MDNSYLIGLDIVDNSQDVLVVTEKGYGKKSYINEYRITKRGSKGVKTINITEKNGNVVGFKSAPENTDLMIITNKGMVIRLDIDSISKMGRVTQGVRLINLKDDNQVSSISIVEKEEESEIIEEEATEQE